MDLTTYDWSIIDKNLIVMIALELNLPDILSLCRTNKRFNVTVCESDNFWYRKIVKDFNFKPDVKNAKRYYQIIQDNWNKLNTGLYRAAIEGDGDLIDFFIQKGADHWNSGMLGAALGGHEGLVHFFIDKGANDWTRGMFRAQEGGHENLVNFFIQKMNE